MAARQAWILLGAMSLLSTYLEICSIFKVTSLDRSERLSRREQTCISTAAGRERTSGSQFAGHRVLPPR